MGIRTHSLFFHDVVVARPDIFSYTVISRSHVRDIIFIKSLFFFASSEFLTVLHFPCLIPGSLITISSHRVFFQWAVEQCP